MTGGSLVPILLWGVALVATAIAVWREGPPVLRGFVVDRLLRYLFLFPLGLQGLWAFVGHVSSPIGPLRVATPTSYWNGLGAQPIALGSGSLRSMPRSAASRRGLPWASPLENARKSMREYRDALSQLGK